MDFAIPAHFQNGVLNGGFLDFFYYSIGGLEKHKDGLETFSKAQLPADKSAPDSLTV